MSSLNASVRIKADAKAAGIVIADTKASLAALTSRIYEAKFKVTDAGGQAVLAGLTIGAAKLEEALKQSRNSAGQFAKQMSLLASLGLQQRLLGMVATMDRFDASVQATNEHLKETGAAAATLKAVSDQLTILRQEALATGANLTKLSDVSKMQRIILAMDNLDRLLARSRDDSGAFARNLSEVGAGRAVGQLHSLMSQLNLFNAALSDAGRGGNKFTQLLSAWGPNFRRAGAGIFFTWAGLHLLIDGLIEVAAVVVPATLALAAFGIAGANSVITIGDHLHQLQQVFHATGVAVGPLTNQFAMLQNKIQPSVIQLYGQALIGMQGPFRTFAGLANTAAAIVDHFGARLVYDIQHGSGAIAALLKQAGPDLTKLMQLFGNLAGVIGHLLRALPGFANFFLDAAVAISHLLDVITNLPTPVLYMILLLHGLYLWGGLFWQVLLKMVSGLGFFVPAVERAAESLGVLKGTSLATAGNLSVFERSAKGAGGTLSKAEQDALALSMGIKGYGLNAEGAAVKTGGLRGALSRMSGTLKGLAVNPWVWATAGIAILGVLAYREDTVKNSTQKLVESLKFPGVEGNTQVLAVAGQNLTKLNGAMRQFNQQGNQQKAIAGALGRAWPTTTQNIGLLTGATHMQVQAGRNLLDGAARIQHAYGVSYPEALAIAKLAHVDLSKSIVGTSKSAQSAWIQIQALEQGYKDMGVTGGQAASDVLALQFALKQQDSQVTQLNSAWDTYIATLSGGQDSLLGWEQQLSGFKVAMTGARISVGSGRTSLSSSLSAAASAAKSTGASMTGTNAASIQLQETWQQLFHSGQSLVDALRLQGLEGPKLTQVIATLAARELILAGNNKTAREELVGFINQAVGPGTVNLRNLDKWVGKNGISMGALRKIVQNLTGQMSNLNKISQTLSSTMQQQVASIFAGTALKAAGVNKEIGAYTSSLIHNGSASVKTHIAWQNAIVALERAGYSYKQATNLLDGYTTGLHRNADVASGGKAARDELHQATLHQSIAFQHVTKDMLAYTTAVVNHGKKSDQARAARKRLIDDIFATGGVSDKTTGKIAGLIAKILHIPKSWVIKILESGVGNFSISEVARGARGAAGNLAGGGSSTGFLAGKHGAAGMLVPGSGNADNVPALLTPGEVVVPKGMVSAGAVDHLRGSIPGFASGGLVQQGNLDVLSGQSAVNYDRNFRDRMVTSMENSMRSVMKQMQAAAQAAAIAAFMDSGARSGNAAIAQSFAASVLPRGWSFPALLSLWNQESGWNAYAVNQSSGAYGIPQSLGHGHPYNLGDYKAQIMWGINYIAGTYGDSQNAWAHEQAFNWYDKGGVLRPGWTMAYNGTGRNERVMPPGEGWTVNINVKVDPVIAAITPDRKLGRYIAEHLKAATRSGSHLFPTGLGPVS